MRKIPVNAHVKKEKPKRKTKRQIALEKYHRRVGPWKKENPQCKFRGCRRHTRDCHHMRGRTLRYLNDESTWMPVCRTHHDWIHANTEAATELGYIIR